jgi:hypothetical protein
MAAPGIAAGAWMARVHGTPGPRFLVAMSAGLATRVLLATSVAIGASGDAAQVRTGLVVGLAAGFVPVLVFEMLWFAGAARSPATGEASRG